MAFRSNQGGSRFIRGVARGPRRRSLWLASSTVSTTLATPSSVIQTSLNAAAKALRPFTIVRSRGLLLVTSDQITTLEFQDIAYGHIVVQDPAVVAGVVSVPTPATDDASDWHVYQKVMNEFLFVTSSGVDGASGRMIEFDSKAMRKVDLGQDLIAVVENVGAGAIVNAYARVLIKLH